jgi:histidinol-phosphate phosphatase family protein
MKKFLILDRDEVLNVMPVEMKYITSPKDVQLKKANIEGLKNLQDLNLRIIVASNQRGIGLGIMNTKDVDNVNNEINKQLSKFNLKVEKFFYCPHRILDNCSCRKPKPGLLYSAASEFKFNLADCIFIGDMPTDCFAGLGAGCRTILLSDQNNELEFIENNGFLGAYSNISLASKVIRAFYSSLE